MKCHPTVTLRVRLTTGEELPLSTKTKRETGGLNNNKKKVKVKVVGTQYHSATELNHI